MWFCQLGISVTAGDECVEVSQRLLPTNGLTRRRDEDKANGRGEVSTIPNQVSLVHELYTHR